jgi:UDP-2,4-diacetamido-2,4,6-trideoxy-beta-L-altropyranose hydrolase
VTEKADAPRAVIRADGSSVLGRGHLVRCRNLARALEQYGIRVTFVRSGGEDGFLADEDVRWIPRVSSQEDGVVTLRMIGPTRPSVVIVDHYALDAAWERIIAESGASVVVIDDLADRDHACDLLIDQNPLPPGRYDGRVPGAAQRLIGARYALLPPDGPSTGGDAAPRERRGKVARLLVGFGGGGDVGPIALALDALSDPRLSGLLVDLVVGADGHVDEVRRLVGPERGHIRVHGWVADLAPMMHDADMALGAGGISILERLRVGLPAVVLTIADNQEASCRALHDEGLLFHVGRAGEVSPKLVADALVRLMQDSEARRRIAEQGPALVDGRGAERCAAEIVDLMAAASRRPDA